MKNVLLVVGLIVAGSFMAFTVKPIESKTTNAEAVTINWLTWDQMVVANKANPKKVIVDVYTDWCGWCKHMDKTTFKDPKVVKYINDNFYPVKLDGEQKNDIVFDKHTFKYVKQGRRGYHALAAALLNNKLSYPSIVYLNEQFQRILISPGYKKVDGMLMELEYTNKEIYNKKSWTDFQAQKAKKK